MVSDAHMMPGSQHERGMTPEHDKGQPLNTTLPPRHLSLQSILLEARLGARNLEISTMEDPHYFTTYKGVLHIADSGIPTASPFFSHNERQEKLRKEEG